METQKPSTMNFAGLDDITDYTGHAYDEVLEKYFAQARFYDAVNRRFITEDPVKDGSNWYVYVRNNPTNAIDHIGLYYVVMYYDKVKKEYRDKVMAESHFLLHARSASNFIPYIGSSSYDIIKRSSQTNSFGVIGGNSISDYNVNKFGNDMAVSAVIFGADEIANYFLGFKPVSCTYSIYQALKGESLNIAKMDDLVMNLFEFYNLGDGYGLDTLDSLPSSVKFDDPLNPFNTSSVQYLVNRMESSYNFIAMHSDYYVAKLMDTNETMFEIDIKLSRAPTKKRYSIIKRYVDIFRYQLSDVKTPTGHYMFSSAQIKQYENEFESYLWSFESRIGDLKEAFRNELVPPSEFKPKRN